MSYQATWYFTLASSLTYPDEIVTGIILESKHKIIDMSTRRQTPVHVETVEPAACSVDLRLSILQQVPFFNDLSAAEIHAVNEQFREFGYEPGEPIYFSGETAVNLYVVAAGQVKLLRH